MKITNKEDTDDDAACDPRLAAFLAVHLVRQIMDDAYVIANSTVQSSTNQSWPYQSMVKNEKLYDSDDNEDVSSNAGSDVVNENKLEHVANVVATSTPQKVTGELSKCVVESGLIGQGDEDLAMRHENELATSTFINQLFDMSEVETVIVCDDADSTMIQSNTESTELLTEAMANIMDSYINTALGIAFKQPPQMIDRNIPFERSSSTEYSEYSLMSDALDSDIAKHIAFYINDADEVIGNENSDYEAQHIVPTVQIAQINDERCEECAAKTDAARFENAYLTLNRDYEQCSEDDGNIILDDPRSMTLQEVELLTANTSEENLSLKVENKSEDKCDKSKDLNATSAVSAVSKKSLVSRCRSQGARLLACIRGWWRRRTPGKRKDHRVPGSIRGICPLSPDARRRAASLIDQRILRSPPPSRGVVWKFNTVNEALVNSTRWKDYTFDVKPDECGEF